MLDMDRFPEVAMTLNSLRYRASLVLLALVACIPMGCELSAPSSSGINVSPASATLAPGQSQEFVASGGVNYTWALSDTDLGSLDTTTGDRAVYTSRATVSTQEITVTAHFTRVLSTDTNATPFTETATANVYPPGQETPPEPVTVLPTSVVLKKGMSQEFTAAEGDGKYAWYLERPAIGRLSSTTGRSVTYKCLVATNVNQTITVASAGFTATAAVQQEPWSADE
jgi:hypothetical protein